jgi:hypothetical protein
MIYLSVGEQSIEDALKNYSKHEALYKEFSGYYHLTQDDPPIYLGYGGDMSTPAKNIGHGIHHGLFGVELKKKSEEVGHNKVYLNLGGKDENGKRCFLTRPSARASAELGGHAVSPTCSFNCTSLHGRMARNCAC